MNPNRTYIISDGEAMLGLSLSRAGEDYFLLHHNGGTKAFNSQGLLALSNMSRALLSGLFDLATTETLLRLEAEAEQARRATMALNRAEGPARPTLENL